MDAVWFTEEVKELGRLGSAGGPAAVDALVAPDTGDGFAAVVAVLFEAMADCPAPPRSQGFGGEAIYFCVRGLQRQLMYSVRGLKFLKEDHTVCRVMSSRLRLASSRGTGAGLAAGDTVVMAALAQL